MIAILLADKKNPWFHAHDFFRVYSDYVLEKLQELPGLELVPEPVYLDELDLKLDVTSNVEIIFSNWGMPSLRKEEIERYFPVLKAVFYAGSSVRMFCLPFFERNVRIFLAGEANAVPAAEYTLAQILLANKGFHQALRIYKDEAGYNDARAMISLKMGNYQAKAGLLGLGRVGSRVAELLKPFDIKVLAYDPYLTPQRARELGVIITGLDEIFSTCEVISSHLPDSAQVNDFLGYECFSLMMPGSTFVNSAQANGVREDDLIRALSEDPSRTAILDSTIIQPLPADHPFMHMSNVFLTPHTAGSFGGEVERMGETLVQACRSFLKGKSSRHEATKESKFWVG